MASEHSSGETRACADGLAKEINSNHSRYTVALGQSQSMFTVSSSTAPCLHCWPFSIPYPVSFRRSASVSICICATHRESHKSSCLRYRSHTLFIKGAGAGRDCLAEEGRGAGEGLVREGKGNGSALFQHPRDRDSLSTPGTSHRHQS